jgi:hypothetical protein
MIYALFTVQYFQENLFLKYLFLLWFVISFVSSLGYFNAIHRYFDAIDVKDIPEIILKARSFIPSGKLPLGLLLNVWIVDFFYLLPAVMAFSKNPINYGYIDSRNRIHTLSFNSDAVSQVVLMAVGITILLVGSFEMQSLFTFIGVISISPYLRKSPSKLSKYYTAVVGEEHSNRPAVYDNLLMRVLPHYKGDWQSSLYLKKSDYSYSIFFHNQRKLWDKQRGVLEVKDYVKSANHLIVLFESADSKLNFVCEYDLIQAFRRR